ncbi:hypothetical protein CANARDRAFT_196424 [[Candida] arabinofermentans NRRL YB-2248]|uniref:Major facilitator superfamily (MFS) profile domain-containing protein n=1 Tax=[Candida] arabinofermentans NRRL YB-2248 TaxID=983967 RepID=A0A1E4T443_9ASCO|nr:hypothetical protein CANARDRAFT_196424 [[Candida] arabinofermentans NRRL YB-2248]
MTSESSPLLSSGSTHNHNHHHHHHQTLIDDVSTGIPGYIAEEIADDAGLNSIKSNDPSQQDNNSISSSEGELTPDDGFLIPKSQLYMIMPALYSLVFLASLDSTILSTLLAEIASDLNAIPYISWIATSYLLCSSIVQPLGRLSDIFGRKALLLICIVFFSLGCLQCSMATSVVSFVIGRFLTGFAGGLNTLTTIIMSDLVPLRQRGVFQGIGNLFYALGSAVGGSIGGYIAHQYGWRAAFWLQIPIGAICFIIIAFYTTIPQKTEANSLETTKEKFQKVDFAGIFSMSLVMFVFITMTSIEYSNIWYFLLVLTFFIICLVTFVKIELNSNVPIVPLTLLSNMSVLGSTLANFFGTMSIFTILYYVPMYLSTVMNLNTQEIGIALVPTIVASSFSSVGSGIYMKVYGTYARFLQLSMVVGIIGSIYLVSRTIPFGLSHIPHMFEVYYLCICPYLGYSVMITVTLLALLASVPIEYQSSVTSMQYAFRGSGSTLGMSTASLIFKTVLSHLLNTKLSSFKPDNVTKGEVKYIIESALHNSDYIRSGAPTWAINHLIEFYAISSWATFVFSLGAAILTLASTCLIKDQGLSYD